MPATYSVLMAGCCVRRSMSLSRRTLVLLIAALRLDGDAFVLQTRVPLDDAPPCSRRARLAPIASSDGEAAARLRNRSFEPIPSVDRSVLEQHDELFDRPGKRKAHHARPISHGQEPQLGCVRRPALSCVDRGPPVLSQTQPGAESWNQTSLGLQVASRSYCSQSDGRGLQAYLACPLRITRSALLDIAGVAPTPSYETLVCRVSGASFPDALTRRHVGRSKIHSK
jgi:hypothetical protein